LAVRDGQWKDDDEGGWADVWIFGDCRMSIIPGFAAVGLDKDYLGQHWDPMVYDDMREGAYDQKARLDDLESNHTDASLAFPTFPRFCGQTFLEHPDRDLGLACIRAYNDWMIDEWCGGPARGRLIPLTLVPLWDPQLASQEIRRCADKGSFAMAFSENPVLLGLPSIHTDHWDPMFAACQDTGTVVNLHIGSSSTFAMTSTDAPRAVSMALTYQGAAHAFCDWLASGVLARFPTLKMALSEGQVGWMPFLLEKLDGIWHERRAYGKIRHLPAPPSSYMDRVYGCVFDDVIGLQLRQEIGAKQIMFETDYPHGDSTWPNSEAVLAKIATEAALTESEIYDLARGNAIRCYGLERFGIAE
jgi:predicted TIM-barrel fold metal-dependent hydrolase